MTAAPDAIVVDRTPGGLLVRTAGEAAATGPAAPDAGVVAVTDAAVPALRRLDRALVAELARLAPDGGLRLLVEGAARPGWDGSPPLAARLAARLGTPVAAAEGPVLALPGGEAFAAGPTGRWWWFPPGGPATGAGPRWPAPPWAAELPGRPLRVPAAVVTPTPAGFWLRSPGGPEPELTDPAYAVPATATSLSVVVGRPGGPPPAATAVTDLYGQLPAALWPRCVLVPYGPGPVGEVLGQRLADALDTEVRALHALPHHQLGGSVRRVAFDAAGRPGWNPYVQVTLYRPGVAPAPLVWTPPVPELVPAGPAEYRLPPGWVLELVPSGFVLRPRRMPSDPRLARRRTDPDQVDLAVTGGYLPGPAMARLGQLVRSLPAEVRDRLRLLAAGPEPDALRVAGAGLAAELGLRPYRLGPDGAVTEIVVPPVRRSTGGRHRRTGAGGTRERVPSGHDGPVSDGQVYGCG